ncbi:molybdopterin molybdotransferase MoeA [Streptacidiphilus monticola]|uniref:Molybdopterin molybdenumtransferase n=1 Tax=Streptacidiphilus monticola TaxID=2161674 RepID=A0ABW1G6A4_9ACTN
MTGSGAGPDLLAAYPFLQPAPRRPGSADSPALTGGDVPYDVDAEEGQERQPVRELSWNQARRAAARAAVPLPPVTVAADATALGAALAEPLTAATDLPAFDTSAMDGWAVSGPGPWRLLATDAATGLAGGACAAALPDGCAVRIATGAPLPPDATAVLRREDGEVTDGQLRETGAEPLATGRDIRPRGQECRRGETLLPAGTVVTPAVLGLAAAAGRDGLTVRRRPSVELFVLGDELLTSGVPSGGRIRDALGPLLPSWLRGYGAAGDAEPHRIPDDLGALTTALRGCTADVVVTTGGTAAGPVDHLHDALRELDAELLVDGVAVRPGHPMLLARLAPGRWIVGLPGNPLAAVAGAATLAEPLLRTLAGLPATEPYRCPAAAALPWHPHDARLVPVLLPERGAVPLGFDGPAMLRGLALAEGLAVVPPGGVAPGEVVEILEVPGGC